MSSSSQREPTGVTPKLSSENEPKAELRGLRDDTPLSAPSTRRKDMLGRRRKVSHAAKHEAVRPAADRVPNSAAEEGPDAGNDAIFDCCRELDEAVRLKKQMDDNHKRGRRGVSV